MATRGFGDQRSPCIPFMDAQEVPWNKLFVIWLKIR